MVPSTLEETVAGRVSTSLRYVVDGVTDIPSELELQDVQWGGCASSDTKRGVVQRDGDLLVESRPPRGTRVTRMPNDWTSGVFISNVVGRGPMVIDTGYSEIALSTDEVVEIARVRGFSWRVVSARTDAILWAADLQFPSDRAPRAFWFPRGNLFVRTAHRGVRGWRFATPEGQVFLVPADDDRERWRIAFEVSSGSSPPSDEHVVGVLALLGFAFGVPMRIGVLQAINDAGSQGGIAHLGLADHRTREEPHDAEAIPQADIPWFVDFVELAVKYMGRHPAAPFLVALHLVNAAYEGFVDTQFLLTFIAAETLARWAIESGALKTSGDIRIADKTAWNRWVTTNDAAIRALAFRGNEQSLVDRVMSSEFNSGTPVQKVFRGEGLGWTAEMEDAERCRNAVAHGGVLGRYGWRGRNWSKDLERVEFVRFMFSALLAQLVDYHGPLADRGIEEGKRRWWRVADPAPSAVTHVCVDDSAAG